MLIRRKPFTTSRFIVLLAALAPGVASAHPGHGFSDNLLQGLVHPLGGLDHLLMILAVSAWAAPLRPAGRVVIAACLALAVGIGALLPVPAGALLETAIALTVVGAGLLLALGRRWPLWATGLLSAGFALVHGFAHGTEGPGGSMAYVTGLVLATGALALIVSFLTARLKARGVWLRMAGAVSSAVGVVALAA